MHKTTAGAVLLAGALTVAGCSKKPPSSLPPEPRGAAQANSGYQSPFAAPGSQADFFARMDGQDTIYFDTDRYNIDSIDAAALQAQADWLRKYPGKRAVLQGHADERGTREYNLALSEKRANSAKNYLVAVGIDPARLSVVGFGKERPAALGSDERAWARNRRAVTITID